MYNLSATNKLQVNCSWGLDSQPPDIWDYPKVDILAPWYKSVNFRVKARPEKTCGPRVGGDGASGRQGLPLASRPHADEDGNGDLRACVIGPLRFCKTLSRPCTASLSAPWLSTFSLTPPTPPGCCSWGGSGARSPAAADPAAAGMALRMIMAPATARAAREHWKRALGRGSFAIFGGFSGLC